MTPESHDTDPNEFSLALQARTWHALLSLNDARYRGEYRTRRSACHPVVQISPRRAFAQYMNVFKAVFRSWLFVFSWLYTARSNPLKLPPSTCHVNSFFQILLVLTIHD